MTGHRDQDYDDFWSTGTAQKPQASPSKRRKGPRAFIFAFILLGLFAAFVYAGYNLADNFIFSMPAPERPKSKAPKSSVQPLPKGMTTVLLLGTDRRAKENGRADTNMLAFIDTKADQVMILSIPRDTLAEIPGRGKQKFGHANAFGGPELVMETVEKMLNIPVGRYVELNFEGFSVVVDTLGGVDMEVEKRMLYPPEQIDLQPGFQHLNGNEALQYVRYRSDGDDTTRIKRQQKFLNVLAQQSFRISNVFKLPELVNEVLSNVDTNMKATELLALAKVFKEAGSADIETVMLPGNPQYIDNISYWVPSVEKAKEIITGFGQNKAVSKEK